MATKEEMLDKVKKLLALGNTSDNNSDEEATAAMLKAQQLMAKYDISAEEVEDQEEEQYAHEACEHKWDYAYRKPLAVILSENFRCMLYMRGNRVVFMGHPQDAKICKATFEFAYRFIMRRGNYIYNKRYSAGRTTKGIFNSYATGFLTGLKEALDAQCRALMIVTPKDVVDEFENMTKDWGSKESKSIQATNAEVYYEGKQDGKSFMDRNKLEG